MSIHNIACEAGVIRRRVLKFILVKLQLLSSIFITEERWGERDRTFIQIFKEGEWRGQGSQCNCFPRPFPHRRLHLQINIFGSIKDCQLLNVNSPLTRRLHCRLFLARKRLKEKVPSCWMSTLMKCLCHQQIRRLRY